MKAEIANMLDECPEGCRLVDPSVEEVVTRKFSGDAKLSVIIDCEHRPICEMWRGMEREGDGVLLG